MKRNHYTWTNIFLQLSPKQKLSSYLHLNDWNKSFNSSRQSTRTTVSAVSGSPGRFIFSAFVIICSYLPSFISFNSSVWFLVITVSWVLFNYLKELARITSFSSLTIYLIVWCWLCLTLLIWAGNESSVVGEDTTNLLDTVEVFGLDGKRIPISDLWKDRKAIVAFSRHFGLEVCLLYIQILIL